MALKKQSDSLINLEYLINKDGEIKLYEVHNLCKEEDEQRKR